jgi:hypothetical protein
MRLLYVGDRMQHEKLRRILIRENVAVRDNLLQVDNFEKAWDFVMNGLCNRQGHIDGIITAEKIDDNPYHIHLVDAIRTSELDYSRHNFKVSSMPIILYDEGVRNNVNGRFGFDTWIEQNEYDNQTLLVDRIRSTIKECRAGVLADLDLLGLKRGGLQGGFFVPDTHYLLKIKPNAGYWACCTGILSEHFIRLPRRLDYDWIDENREGWEKAIDRYADILAKLTRYNRVNSEKRVLHVLYNENKWLLRLDVFGTPIYEPALMKNGTGYEEPDYVLPSSLPGYIPTNITEIKPHLLPILNRRRRKPRLMSKYEDAMVQVSDYERHTRTKRGRSELNKVVDYRSSNLTFTLLASNDKEMEFNLRRIEELCRDHYPKIKAETHDERLRKAIQYFERNELVNILK